VTSRDAHEFGVSDARGIISAPTKNDDKYSRGVVGFITGSVEYPGAAVLGVSAAYRTGVGMVRYVGPDSVGQLVLARRPETVLGMGSTRAWVIGSGVTALTRTDETFSKMRTALESGQCVVMDAGALDLVSDLPFPDRVIITPHAGELSRLMSDITGKPAEWTDAVIASDPADAAARAAAELGVVVCLKGHVTNVVALEAQVRSSFALTSPTTWLATAGTGDVLAGIMGAVLATYDPESAGDLARCAAAAVYIHGRAANIASGGGPIAALEVSEAVPAAIVEVLSA
jgi:hydroxyethylthiazole kinase-like uncharacterized protein yjeF